MTLAPPSPRAIDAAARGARLRVLVVGGGLAGIAAALRLAEAGAAVTLLETRKKLGGRATSFLDARTGRWLDNCQHVALRCCVNYLDLLARLEAADQLTWTSRQWWVEAGGRTSVIEPARLPAPLHFGPSVVRAPFLTWRDVLALGRAGPAILAARRDRWRARTFADFLAAHHQPASLIERFWAPVVVSACNLACERVSAASALQVFQEGFFARPDAADVGVSRVPLLELYDRAEAALARAGGRVLLGHGVEHLDARSATTTAGERFEADAVVCALPPERAGVAVDESLRARDRRFAAMAGIEFSPILGVHLDLDRPVLGTPHAVLVEGQVQWLFRKDDAGARVHAVISAADAWVDVSEATIIERVMGQLRDYLPAAAGARVLAARAVKEKRATFAATPQFEAQRVTALPRDDDHAAPAGPPLVLAGDYTATGWPATMEGAVRSGYVAAAAVLGVEPATLLAPDLRPGALARAAGLRAAVAPVAR